MSFGNPFAGANANEFGALGLGFNGFEVSLDFVSGVPDPNIITNSSFKLVFKSLLKRDETTKEKALNELLKFLTADNISEIKNDLVIITWIQLYPKLSISENKSVRLLAHQVQCCLISLLQKFYLKYLKDSLPILLSGLYDSDSSVSNSILKSLNEIFNDQLKINNLWILFQHEILNFINQVLNKETIDSLSDDRFVAKDEAELKYLRLVNATILMISHLLQLSIKLDKLDPKLSQSFQSLFNYENLWHYLLVNSNTNNQRIFKSLLSLTNAVLNLKPDLFNDKSWKLLSKRFLKSLTFVKKIENNSSNYLIYSSVILPILSTLVNLDKLKPDFYNFDKTPKEKILEFLKIGSLNSSALYYIKLLEYLKSSNIIDLNADSTIIQNILLKDFKTELNKNSKLREGSNFIINSLSTYLQVASLISNNEESFNVIFDEVLIVKTSIINQLIDLLVKFIPDSIVSSKLETIDDDIQDLNLTILLKIALLKNITFEPLLIKVLDSLRLKSEEDEQGTTFINHPAFEIFKFVIMENQSQYSSKIEEFVDELPTFITSLIIDIPIEILIIYSNSKIVEKSLFIETFNNFIIKLDLLNSKERLLSQLDRFGYKNELLNNSEELQTTINEASSNYDFSNDELFKEHLLTEESVLELYQLSVKLNKFDKFLEFYFKHNSSNEELFKHLIQNSKLIEENLWNSELNEHLHSKFDILLEDDGFLQRYVESLKSYISLSGSSFEITSEVSSKIAKFPIMSTSLFNFQNSIDSLQETYQVIDSRLYLGNPLESNIFLFTAKEDSFPLESIRPVLNYSVFLKDLFVGVYTDELVMYLGIMSEIGNDFTFLSNDESQNDTLFKLKDDVMNLINTSIAVKFDEILLKLISNEKTSTFIDDLLDETGNDVLRFYKYRILLQVLNHLKSKQVDFKISTIGPAIFDKLIKSNIRSKDLSSLLQISIISLNLSEFLNDSQFANLRNLIASELIGLRNSEILSNGLNKLTILNNFLISWESDEPPLQPQRLNLILNELNKWIDDSDLSMDEHFNVLRIQIMKFLSLLYGVSSLTSQLNIIDLIVKLLQDSVGLINIGDCENLIELKYNTLKLFLSIKKDDNDFFDRETIDDLDNELLECYKLDEDAVINQPIVILNDLFNRFLNTLSIKQLRSSNDVFVEKYFKTNLFDNKRILLAKIEELILMNQQDLVIEFELSKGEEIDEKFNIKEIFIKNVLNPPNLKDYENDDDRFNQLLISYLWNWRLILIHFQNITLNLRSYYIKQLQNFEDIELLSNFLTFLSNLILFELNNDKAYLNSLTNEEISNYSYHDINNLSLEVKNLSINLYYSILNCISSLSVNWFNNLKDRGFKSKFENLTVNYISPNLIKDKLLQFQNKAESFTSKDDNLTIKINKQTNEIKIIYLIDEQNMEIIFKFPSNYPLQNIEVLGTQRIGVKETLWKNWILSSQRILSITNGEIEESLNFFLKNLKFHFKGFEECAICYSILHSDNSLPTKKCSTCENKFHSGCLYKWFKSSGGNTCPLCRSMFNFR